MRRSAPGWLRSSLRTNTRPRVQLDRGERTDDRPASLGSRDHGDPRVPERCDQRGSDQLQQRRVAQHAGHIGVVGNEGKSLGQGPFGRLQIERHATHSTHHFGCDRLVGMIYPGRPTLAPRPVVIPARRSRFSRGGNDGH